MNDKRPKVGLAVYVMRDGKFLMGKRLGSHGEGSWCVPGGHLEFGESFEDCARREVLEETGMKIKNIKFLGITNDIFTSEDKHYITISMRADWAAKEPVICEPDKYIDQSWFTLDALPSPLFLPLENLLKQKIKL
jgi:8-oxo-dGTP diphosphatase